jgi:hypothetical protein
VLSELPAPGQNSVRVGSEVDKVKSLTFDAKGEIITSSGGIADLPARLTLFSPFLRIYFSFIIGSCLLRIRNS